MTDNDKARDVVDSLRRIIPNVHGMSTGKTLAEVADFIESQQSLIDKLYRTGIVEVMGVIEDWRESK